LRRDGARGRPRQTPEGRAGEPRRRGAPLPSRRAGRRAGGRVDPRDEPGYPLEGRGAGHRRGLARARGRRAAGGGAGPDARRGRDITDRRRSLSELEGRVAGVTGGASGIGRAMAGPFGRERGRVRGARVAEGALVAVVESIEARGGEALGVRTDVTSLASVEALAERAFKAFGKVNVLCNNAGVALWGGLESHAPGLAVGARRQSLGRHPR